MNKSQLINAVAEEVKLTKIEENLAAGEKVVISGFGVFSVTSSPERVGRNPRTGEPVKIEPRRNVKFRSNMEIK